MSKAEDWLPIEDATDQIKDGDEVLVWVPLGGAYGYTDPFFCIASRFGERWQETSGGFDIRPSHFQLVEAPPP